MANDLSISRRYRELSAIQFRDAPFDRFEMAGKLIIFKARFFGPKQKALKTYEYSLVHIGNNGKRLPEPVWVPTANLAKKQQKRIYTECLACKWKSWRKLYILRIKGCKGCQNKIRQENRQSKLNKIIAWYPNIRFIDDPIKMPMAKSLQFKLGCGCKFKRPIKKLLARPILICRHTSPNSWAIFERIIKDHFYSKSEPFFPRQAGT